MSNSFYHNISGARWLPSFYGNWNSIYHKFRQWCKLGIFEKILQIINQDAADYSLMEIDSTFCKVHKSACSVLKNQSRSGIHVLVNERMQMLNVVLSGGQLHDSKKAIELLAKLNLKCKCVLADRAFSAEQIRGYVEKECGMYPR